MRLPKIYLIVLDLNYINCPSVCITLVLNRHFKNFMLRNLEFVFDKIKNIINVKYI